MISAHDDYLETNSHVKKEELASESSGKMPLCSERRVSLKYLTASSGIQDRAASGGEKQFSPYTGYTSP